MDVIQSFCLAKELASSKEGMKKGKELATGRSSGA